MGAVVAVVGVVVAAVVGTVVDAVLGITVGAVVAFVAGSVVGAEVNTVVGASVAFVAGAVVDSVVAAVLGFVSVLPAGFVVGTLTGFVVGTLTKEFTSFVVAATPVPTVPFVPGATGVVVGTIVPAVPLVAGLVPGFVPGFVAIAPVEPAGISVADITVLSVEVVPSIGFATDSPVDSCIESAVGPVVGISVCVVIATVETGTAAEGFGGFTGFLSGSSRITTTAIAKAATAKSHRISFFCGGTISFSVKGFMQ